MKKISSIFFAVVLSLGVYSASAFAFGIDISATVSSNYSDSWDADSLSGTALYTLSVLPASIYGANVFTVTFEDDIFASVSNIQLLSPSGWSVYTMSGSSGYALYEIVYSGTDVLDPGETPYVAFTVDYVLESLERAQYASGTDWAWDEGGVWQQAVSATNTFETLPLQLGGGNPSGGTSTSPVPEPATLMLLGSSLLGLAGIGAWKKRDI